MKKILITGANGFIGSFLVEEALKRNYEVYAGIRKTSNTEYLTDPRIKFTELDFENTNFLNLQLSQLPSFDFVIHNAGTTKAFKKKDYFISNYQYTKNIVDALISQKKVNKKFIYMSSLAAYGPGDPLQQNSVSSTDTPKPVTSYGKSKLESEKYLISLTKFPHIIIRPTVVYGPREKDLFTIFKLINNNLELFVGFKNQQLTFIYVKDLVKAVFQTMESNVINKGYFVSDGNVYDAQSLGDIIKKKLGKKTVRIYVPKHLVRVIALFSEASKYLTRKQPVLNFDKVNELECVNWKCDNKPLIDEFNFKSDYDLNKGIFETIEWYKKSKWL